MGFFYARATNEGLRFCYNGNLGRLANLSRLWRAANSPANFGSSRTPSRRRRIRCNFTLRFQNHHTYLIKYTCWSALREFDRIACTKTPTKCIGNDDQLCYQIISVQLKESVLLCSACGCLFTMYYILHVYVSNYWIILFEICWILWLSSITKVIRRDKWVQSFTYRVVQRSRKSLKKVIGHVNWNILNQIYLSPEYHSF